MKLAAEVSRGGRYCQRDILGLSKKWGRGRSKKFASASFMDPGGKSSLQPFLTFATSEFLPHPNEFLPHSSEFLPHPSEFLLAL